MTREEKLALAGEFVLGLLEPQAAADIEQRRRADPELDRMIGRLAGRLSALDDTAVPHPVPPDLWARIADGLGEQNANVVSLPAPMRRTWAYPASLAASVLVAAALGFWAGLGSAGTPQPVVIAVLMDEASQLPGAIVEAFGDDSVSVVPLEQFEVPAGRILQVWTLPDPATGPVSLGTFSESERIRLAGPNLPVPTDGQFYEITLEPSPGSPTGRPTGPILVKGFARVVR